MAQDGIPVVTRTVYRMVAKDEFPADVVAALRGGLVAAVLHYSRRSASAFVAAARHAGIEGEALAPHQICMSEGVAEGLRAAGAEGVSAAATPDEDAVFATLQRLVPSSS